MSKLHLVVARPRHEHDCDVCQLVGIKNGADLYFCPSEVSYVVRRSSDGPDYSSLSLNIVVQLGSSIGTPLLWEARQRHLALMEMLEG
jgi:hypothetical protein